MESLLYLTLWLVGVFVFWLLPLYFVCRWAKAAKKNYQAVFLVGFFTGWLLALIVALLIPPMDEAAFAVLGRKSERKPLGESAIVLGGLGVCTVLALAFGCWLKWGL